MSSPFKGITLHEGYNDIGSFEVNITKIEEASPAISYTPIEFPPVSRKLLFRLQFEDGKPVTQAYKGEFDVLGRAESENTTYTAYPNADGFIEIDTPVFPVVPKPEDTEEEWLLRISVNGPLNERAEEAYFEVLDASSASVYTLIWDICVHEGYLAIRSEAGNYYTLATEIAVGSSIRALHITATGKVFGFDVGTGIWNDLGTLEFTMIEFPENLDTVEDGFYETTGGTGTLTTWEAGGTGFEDYAISLLNPGLYLVNVDVDVSVEPTGNVFSGTFSNKMPGSLNFIPVSVTGSAPAVEDDSPTMEEIQTISGVTFSEIFSDFLAGKELTTVDRVRKAGPIVYINDYPDGVTNGELNTLQAHVDFYSLNKSLTQNQRIISQGYKTTLAIAYVPRKTFLDAVVNEDLPLFQAAKIYELAVQNQNLTASLLPGIINDLRMEQPTTPAVLGSNFTETALAAVLNSCGCDDCKSVISPFAYLLDLLKYGAGHVKHSASPTYSPGGNISSFVTLMSTKFLQPFGTLNIDCKTLHDEFCRVRLVSEVLESLVSAGIAPARVTPLANERNQFFQLVYQTILLQAGSSINEVRNVHLMQPADDKLIAAQKLSDKLGIPLYVPTTSDYTIDALWLTIINTAPANVLNAGNLEHVFGFRNTQRNVLTDTPVSLIELWHAAYLRDFWKTQDYLFSAYSREDVNPADDTTFKDNWKPILDPDLIGWADFTYNTSLDMVSIWQNRKADTDAFLQYCLTAGNGTTSVTSVDMAKRILRIPGRDLASQVIENNTVSIYDSTPALVAFKALQFKVTDTDTDVYLDQLISPAIFQPDAANTVMHYNRVLQVLDSYVTGTGTTTIVIAWPEDTITDAFSGGYVKFQSVTGAVVTAYETGGVTNEITAISFDSALQVTLTVNNTGIDSTFLNGTLSFVYEAEVPLYTTEIIAPELVIYELFNHNQSYNKLIAPSSFSPVAYKVWDEPSAWPVFITAVSDYTKLKQMYQFLSVGNYTDEITELLMGNLFMTKTDFNRMMDLLHKAELYLGSMYTEIRPTVEELYELASCFRNSAKTVLRFEWLKEEIEYEVSPGIALNTRLDGKYFWKSLTEPLSGSWDPSLQVLPLIDPELIRYESIVPHPEANTYRALYTVRKGILEGMKDTFWLSINTSIPNGFTEILNTVNTGFPGTPYSILPYSGSHALDNLMNDLNGQDAFKQKLATDTLWTAFAINAEDFRTIYQVKTAYEGNDPSKAPTFAQLDKAIDQLVSGYKRKWKYGTWSAAELSGSATGGIPVKYYNLFQVVLPLGRSNPDDRKEWQRTLDAWNRQSFIQPDLVPPENIKNFVATNWVYTAWNARKTAFNAAYNTITAAFAPGMDAGDLFTELKDQLSMLVARITDFTVPPVDYSPYFLGIKTIEDRGDDIRPNLAQLGIAPSEYRVLRNVYDILEQENTSASTSPSSLVASEYQDVADIIIHIRSVNLPFAQVLEEYNHNIILDQDYFLNYQPALISFPLSDLPVYNAWRSPAKDRKTWKETLEGRIEMEQGVTDRWKEVLEEAEDRNMPLMRDALIRALTADCEAWQDKAEKLAKTYFIETKDNCCVKHTRVSFAIETMQGFLLALQNGIYDGFISNFSLIAPSFVKEWEWLGSYATWRAAIFVYMYPENLLYPTLKKLQSPAFIKLSQTLQQANRFSPEDACRAADEYSTYLEDLKDLTLICNVNGRAKIYPENTSDCCSNPPLGLALMSFYFAQGKSGTSYWSYKDTADTTREAHSFWYELPVRKDAKPIGCFYFGTRGEPGWSPLDMYLVFFYSFNDKGAFKIAYIKKKVFDPDSSWTEEKETDEIPGVDNKNIKHVTACQNTVDWDAPNFSIAYIDSDRYVETIRWFNPFTDKWESPTFNNTVVTNLVLPFVILHPSTTTAMPYAISLTPPTHESPQTCIRFIIKSTVCSDLTGYVHVFKDLIVIRGYNGTASNNPISITDFDNILGAYEKNVGAINTFTVFYNEHGRVKAVDIKVNCDAIAGSNVTLSYTKTYLTSTDTLMDEIVKVLPVCKENGMQGLYAFNLRSDNERWSGTIRQTTSISLLNLFALTPSKIADVPLQSAECIPDMNARLINIKAEIVANTPPSTRIVRTTVVKEVLYEAYYFVPMLLALDQQKRGEYTTALNWYRSVYDYTLSLNYMRKIFYGLKLEESIVNVYTQAPNWLLDPLNPHLVAQSRANAYTQYTVVNIVQCLFSYADREFTLDTIESVPVARRIYTEALELLKIRELNRRPNGCDEVSDCVTTKVDLPGREWDNALTQVKTKLKKLGSVTLMESIETDLVDLLNSGTEDTYAETFAAAFQLIDDTVPAPTPPRSMTEGLLDFAKHANFAYSYLHALSDHSDFNATVESNFTGIVTTISGITQEELDTPDGESRMAWLKDQLPDNSQPYTFRFANDDGIQQLRGADRYNPLSPTTQSQKANLSYANANPIAAQLQWPMPKEWVPLVDYAFCMPKNPVYDSLILKGNVELYKIFNCRNIAGMVRELDPYAAATDSVTGMPFIGAGGNLVTPGIGNFRPSQYRFRTLMERAKQIAAQAQQMESLFLSALEKEDAENYSQLRAKQDLQTAKATVKLQNLRITQATDERGIADIQLTKATFSQQHYEDLLSAGMNAYEIASLILLQAAVVSEGVAAAAKFASIKDYVSGLSSLTQVLSLQSNVLSQLASFQRRAEEWGFQKDLAGFDVSLATQQIKVAEDNIRVVTQERDIAQMNTDHAQDSLEFLKTKFTNAELYNFMGNVLERSYSYMLNLATAIARTAEGQLYFERQEQAGPFILDDYWETPSAGSLAGSGNSTDRRGITGSARLLVDITRLDQYAFDTNKRKLQMSKVISLAQNFPSEFQEFKETGVLNFALTNKLFDYDFPGQYLRLINSVKTTVVGLLPVYDGIKATLTAGATSYTVIGGTIFQRTPIRRASSDSVALTSPNNATGLFELQPAQNELLNPFESMGIESQWEFKMPKFSNRLDYSNIADVLLTVEYTALDSFEYRTQVLQDLDNSLSFNRGFSFKNNFPDQWYELADVQQGAPGSSFSVTIELKRDMFPQGIRDLRLNPATGVLLYFVREDGYTNEIAVGDFNLAGATAAGPSGDTVNGVFRASNGINSSATPLLKLKLSFANTAVNRQLFTENHVTDIMLLVGCKADLMPYPL